MIQKITNRPIIEVWKNLQNYIFKYLKMENWFIIQNFFSGWVEQSADILMLRHENHFIEKMVFMPRPRWWIVQTRTHEVHHMAKLRSRGEVKFVLSIIIVSYLVWVEQYMALTQKETLPSTNCHNGSRKGHFWITCHLHTFSCLIGTRVVIRPEGHFFHKNPHRRAATRWIVM
jgi:hypothetical protein